jgi:hypothetical protein
VDCHRQGTWPARQPVSSSVARAKRLPGVSPSAQTLSLAVTPRAPLWQQQLTVSMKETVPFSIHWPHCPGLQSVGGRRARSRASLARLAHTVAVVVPPGSLIHVAAPASRASTVLAAITGATQWQQLVRRGAAGPYRAVRFSPRRRPNHHWSGRPPASRLGREASAVYHPPRGQVAFPASAAQLKR